MLCISSSWYHLHQWLTLLEARWPPASSRLSASLLPPGRQKLSQSFPSPHWSCVAGPRSLHRWAPATRLPQQGVAVIALQSLGCSRIPEGTWDVGAQAQLLYLQTVHWLSLSPVTGSSPQHMWPKTVSSFPPLDNRHQLPFLSFE